LNIRMIAGLGMLLLASGLMFVWYLGQQQDPASRPAAESATIVPAVGIPGLGRTSGPAVVDSFLTVYNTRYADLAAARARADWSAALEPGEASGRQRLTTSRALGDFTGSRGTITGLRRLRGRSDLGDLQTRQIERAWQLAAVRPGTRPDLAARILALDTALREAVATRPAVAPTDPTEMQQRLDAWKQDRDRAAGLRAQLAELRDLRNRAAREMGYSSWFGLQAATHGLTGGELTALLQQVLDDLRPLYRHLQCWARHELAARYGTDPPRMLPIHWLDDPAGASWPSLANPAPVSTDIQPGWLVENGVEFWLSLGFKPLGTDAVTAGGDVSAPATWDLDSAGDVRTLLGPVAGLEGLAVAHGQIGLAHAWQTTARPEIPILLRGPADGLTGHTIVELGRLQTRQPPYLERLGWPGIADAPDEIRRLLDEAITGPLVGIPFLLGTLAGWEYDFYENDLPAHRINNRWWELVGTWQGLAAPGPRGEELCDAAAVSLVITDPAAGWQQALGMVAAHQLHRYVCRELLDQDVRTADWFGSREGGLLLHDVMALGGTRDGLVILSQATGEELSAAAMLDYYAPLLAWLEQENAHRDVGF